MNEWTNEWTSEWTNEWTDEWTNGPNGRCPPPHLRLDVGVERRDVGDGVVDGVRVGVVMASLRPLLDVNLSRSFPIRVPRVTNRLVIMRQVLHRAVDVSDGGVSRQAGAPLQPFTNHTHTYVF